MLREEEEGSTSTATCPPRAACASISPQPPTVPPRHTVHSPPAPKQLHLILSPPPPNQMLPLGKLYNDRRYSAKNPLPGVHPAALAPWTAATKNTPRPSATQPGTSATSWWQLPSPASAAIVPTPGLPDWGAACGACAAAPSVEALPAALRERCRLECGFWSGREAAAVRRSVRELAHRAAAEARNAAGGAAVRGRRRLGA